MSSAISNVFFEYLIARISLKGINGFLIVHNICDLFNEFADGALVSFGRLTWGEEKIDFSEVHAHRLRDEGLEEAHHEVDGDTDVLWGACRGKLLVVNPINVEGDPVRLLLAIGEEVALHLLFDLRDTLGGAKFRIIPGDLAFDKELHLFGLPLPDSKVDEVLKRKHWLLIVGGESSNIGNRASMNISRKTWLRSVCINVRINPENAGGRPHSFHAVYWPDALRVITSKHDRVLLSSQRLSGCFLKLLAWSIHIFPVAFARSVALDDVLIKCLIALLISDSDHLARHASLSLHLLQPFLLEEPFWSEFRSRTLLATSEGEPDDVHWPVEGTEWAPE
jgi:hypothetical protein